MIVAAFSCVSTSAVGAFQIVGAMLLLWATVFVRGWDIQTIKGVSLPERVNRWLYLVLCFMGTIALVASLFLRVC